MKLDPALKEFIDKVDKWDQLGCILAPREELKKLDKFLDTAELYVAHLAISRERKLPATPAPALWLVANEEYEADPAWAEAIRARAAYFHNI